MGERTQQEENPAEKKREVKQPHWESAYIDAEEQGRDVDPEIKEYMPGVIETFKENGVKTVLDLGCGQGKNSVYLAEHGFKVKGLDGAPTGVEATIEKMAKSLKQDGQKLEEDFTVGDIYEPLPYDDKSFDAILSTQVIHHNTIDNIRKLIAEMARILKPEGPVFVTVVRFNPKYGSLNIPVPNEPHTFTFPDGKEIGLPHYFFDEERLQKEFEDAGFEVNNIWAEEGEKHTCLLGKRKQAEREQK